MQVQAFIDTLIEELKSKKNFYQYSGSNNYRPIQLLVIVFHDTVKTYLTE